MQINQIVQLRNDIMDFMEKAKVLEQEKSEAEQEIATLKDLIASKKSEGDREQRNPAAAGLGRRETARRPNRPERAPRQPAWR